MSPQLNQLSRINHLSRISSYSYYGNISEIEIGEIIFLSNIINDDSFLLCDGSEISRSDYPDLFLLLGTRYGSGDGLNTFNIPDAIDRYPIGYSSSFNSKPEFINFHHVNESFNQNLISIQSSGTHAHSYTSYSGFYTKSYGTGLRMEYKASGVGGSHEHTIEVISSGEKNRVKGHSIFMYIKTM